MSKTGTFRITCQRMDDFYMSSKEMEKEVGAYIVEKTQAKVKLKDADQDIHIEIINGKAYLFAEKIQGMGGVPLNVDSRVVLLLQNKDSIKAGIKMIRRGCMMDVFKEKDIDYSELKKYEYGFTIHELDKIENQTVIVADTLESMHEYPFFVLRPLI
jgi:adenylyl- and sulfurtransferase ThiI